MYARRHWLWLLVFASGVTAWDYPAASWGGIGESRPVRRRWALLIGVTYQGLEHDGYPELPNAANDAKELARYLKKYYDGYTDETVFLLTDEKGSDPIRWPTRATIRSAMAELEKKADKLDSVLIFFAGHAAPLENGGLAFLPRDYKVRDNGRDLVSNSLLDLKSFPVREFGFPCHQKLLILDCCYAGQVFGGIAWKEGDSSAAESPYRDEPYFARRPAFQVVTSARATQRASDGTGLNSKFTAHFLRALTVVGANRARSKQPYVRAQELVDYVRLCLSDDDEQLPDCRKIGKFEGEFVFLPKNDRTLFKGLLIPEERQVELLAAVASQQGYWWFEEMPWCIPSIRAAVFERFAREQKEAPTRGRYSLWTSFDTEQIRSVVEALLHEANKEKGLASEGKSDPKERLRQMRFAHAQALLNAQGNGRMTEVCRRIEQDLTEWKKASPLADVLEAEDLHLLAVVRHSLRQANGREAYEEALEAYERRSAPRFSRPNKTKDSSSPDRISVERIQKAIPQALCYADFGEYFQEIMNDPKEAVAQYRRAIAKVAEVDPSLKGPACEVWADELTAAGLSTSSHTGQRGEDERSLSEDASSGKSRIGSGDVAKRESSAGGAGEPSSGASGSSSPDDSSNMAVELNQTEAAAKLFSVFVLTRMADAHLMLGHWDDAEGELACALAYVREVAPSHYLEAHVYRRRAWAEIIRWQMKKAHRSFARSNAILDWLFQQEWEVRSGQAVDDGSRAALRIGDGQFQELTQAFHASKNYAAKLAYLHNRHGMAMAKRFLGDSAGAARLYRQLSADVEHTTNQFRRTMTDRELERHYVIRVINTLERLGDCNLFGMPAQRQLGEAYDDYRRALQRVHLLRQWESAEVPYRASDRWRGTLLYKQALALSLPSNIQDTELALELCEEADAIYEKHAENATGLWQALGTLTTPVVQLLNEVSHVTVLKDPLSNDTHQTSMLSAHEKAADHLRSVILQYRDVVGLQPHRDQLELCLFASKVLLEHGGARSPRQSQFDAELLHSFCRLTLETETYKEADRDGQGVNRDDSYEAQSYIRPYYDAVFRARWRHAKGNGVVVKELLELQAEAVTGKSHHKPPQLQPIFAMYYLASEDECVLLWDDSRSPGVCVPMSHYYDLDEARSVMARRRASFHLISATRGPKQAGETGARIDRASLPLPRLIRDRVLALLSQGDPANGSFFEVIWRGDLRFLAESSGPQQPRWSFKPPIPDGKTPPSSPSDFPFQVPPGIRIISDQSP